MKMMSVRTLTALAATALLLPLASGVEGQDRPTPPRVEVAALPAVAPLASAWIGLQIEEREGVPELDILDVEEGSPGDDAGLREGEVIVLVDGEAATLERLRSRMTRLDPGDTIRLQVRAPDGGSREVAVETAERMPQLWMLDAEGDTTFFRLDRGETFADVQERFFGSRPGGGGIAQNPALSGLRTAIVTGTATQMGQDAVAGARFTPINEGLSTYFGVERGLLVVEVVEGTPAADSGLESGDVVVRVDGAEVRAVEELRRTIMEGYRSPPVQLRVVREGREIELELDRE